MKRGETYSSGWLKAQDMLDQGKSNGMDLTIKSVTTSTMDDGKMQRTLAFNEDDRELGLNVTNWDSIAQITGKDDDEHWIGSVVNIHPIKLDRPYNGKTHGLRVRQAQGVGPARVAQAGIGVAAPVMADAWTFAQASDAVQSEGLNIDEFKAYLKAQGFTAWNGSKHTDIAKAWIRAKRAVAIATPGLSEEEIPFSWHPLPG